MDLHNKYTKTSKKMSLHISKDQKLHCNKENTNQTADCSALLQVPGDCRHKPSGLMPDNLLTFVISMKFTVCHGLLLN